MSSSIYMDYSLHYEGHRALSIVGLVQDHLLVSMALLRDGMERVQHLSSPVYRMSAKPGNRQDEKALPFGGEEVPAMGA